MRRTKTIKIDDLEVTFRELRVRDVRRIWEDLDSLDDQDLLSFAADRLPLICDLPAGKLEDLAPSEIRQLYDAFAEVNAELIEGLKKSGLAGVLKEQYRKTLTALPAILSNAAMSMSSTTDGASS